MIIVNGKTMLKIGGQAYMPGETIEVPDALAQRLANAGLVETADNQQPVEVATTKTRKKR